jgi:hypothetical protein
MFKRSTFTHEVATNFRTLSKKGQRLDLVPLIQRESSLYMTGTTASIPSF